ncbi:MAG: Cytidylate kinase (Cytidine monophosphate kinase) kinase [Pseudomonadota bacterium]|jgi:cytidylate kinase
MDIPVLTIDGPSGAGKGTVSRLLAKQLGWHYLDSGAIYRALALVLTEKDIEHGSISDIVEAALAMHLSFECDKEFTVLLNGQNITDLLGLESTGNSASKIAVIPEIRAALLKKQHDFKQAPGLVADGRDMGTVVFPDAKYKVFLTASASQRAERRYKQLKLKGIDAKLSTITTDIQERDQRDSERQFAPLVPAADAIYIDSSTMSIQAVIAEVLSLVR